MDRYALSLLEAASVSLHLNGPVPPWGLGLDRGRIRQLVRPPLPTVFDPILAPATPLPYDLDPELVIQAFLSEDRLLIANQIDDGYRRLHVLREEQRGEVDDDAVVTVQLGVPLIGRDRALLRIRTANVYRDLSKQPRRATADFHAWLDPDGQVTTNLTDAQASLAQTWPRWVPGRSPGLPARRNLNHATEAELKTLPGVTAPILRAILAGRPFGSVADLLDLKGVGPRTLAKLRDWVEV